MNIKIIKMNIIVKQFNCLDENNNNYIINKLDLKNKEDIYKEIYNYFKEDNLKVITFLYFNRTIIHNILYDKEAIISLNSNVEKNILSYYFYLYL